MLIGNIYKLTSPSGKSYIGQTRHLNKRMKIYKRCACSGQWKLLHALKKYGFENFKIEILFEFKSYNEQRLIILLDAMEKFCIKKCNSVYNGYNIRFGGAGGKCTEETLEKMRLAQRNRSEETKQKMSEWQKGKRLPEIAYERSRKTNTGRPMPQHVKDATIKSNIGRIVTEEHKQILREFHTGKKLSNETKLKLSIINTGRKHTDETKAKISECSKNLSDETRKKISNSRIKNTNRDTILRKNINNGSWFSEFGLNNVRNAALIGIGVVRLDSNGNYVDEFISINEAIRICGISQNTIRKSIQQKKVKDNRFKWIKKCDYNKININKND